MAMSDFQLCAIKDHKTLWQRWEGWSLSQVKSHLWAFDSFDDMKTELYFVFRDVLEKTDLPRISDPDSFSFSSRLYFTLKNFKNDAAKKLERRQATEAHLPGTASPDNIFGEMSANYESGEAVLPLLKTVGEEPFTRFSPEYIVLRDKTRVTAERTKLFKQAISGKDHQILSLRRRKVTYDEIARMIGKSSSFVKDRVRKAKAVASKIFEVEYV